MLPGGTVQQGSVGVRNGRIAAISREPPTAERSLDFGEALVLPGVVDAHVHTRSALDEGITRCTRAAAAGGVTTIIDMPYDNPDPVDSAAAFRAKVEDVEREAVVDAALWGTVPKEDGALRVRELADEGASSLKVSTYETHPRRFPQIPDGELLEVLAAAAEAEIPVGVHPENDGIARRGISRLRSEGRTDPEAHAESRPPVAETEATSRVLELAHYTGAEVHVCHATVARNVEHVRRARAEGTDASVETCPHYLIFDELELLRQGGAAKINPPLRPREEVEELWRLLAAGKIDLVSSDHVGWSPEAKQREDIFEVASGCPGVELILPLMFSEGTARRGLSVGRLAELLCEGPARRFGLWPRKGALLPGSDADLAVLDPAEEWTVRPEELVTAAGWSPYTGMKLAGWVRHTILRGEVVYDGERVIGEPGSGGFVRPERRKERAFV